MYRGDDILKIYDQDLNNIGRATREEVHTQGLLHQVAHVWMFQPKEDDTYIMIQKRSLDRELYPGKYDLIQTTHFDPDESYEEAIVDSLEYYRGLKKSKEDIIHVGSTHQQIDAATTMTMPLFRSSPSSQPRHFSSCRIQKKSSKSVSKTSASSSTASRTPSNFTHWMMFISKRAVPMNGG